MKEYPAYVLGFPKHFNSETIMKDRKLLWGISSLTRSCENRNSLVKKLLSGNWRKKNKKQKGEKSRRKDEDGGGRAFKDVTSQRAEQCEATITKDVH